MKPRGLLAPRLECPGGIMASVCWRTSRTAASPAQITGATGLGRGLGNFRPYTVRAGWRLVAEVLKDEDTDVGDNDPEAVLDCRHLPLARAPLT